MPRLVETEPDITVSTAYVPEWREVTIIFRRPAGNILALDGWQYGKLIVHATWDDPSNKPFTVTHLGSRLVVCRANGVDGAVEAAEWLWEQCPRLWSELVVDVKSMPGDVVQWCRENQ